MGVVVRFGEPPTDGVLLGGFVMAAVNEFVIIDRVESLPASTQF
jgi:hypothetical protein